MCLHISCRKSVNNYFCVGYKDHKNLYTNILHTAQEKWILITRRKCICLNSFLNIIYNFYNCFPFINLHIMQFSFSTFFSRNSTSSKFYFFSKHNHLYFLLFTFSTTFISFCILLSIYVSSTLHYCHFDYCLHFNSIYILVVFYFFVILSLFAFQVDLFSKYFILKVF